MITLRVNMDSIGLLVTSGGGRVYDPLPFQYQAYQVYKVIFGTVDGGVFTPADVSGAITWTAAGDKDFNHATEPMVQVPNEDVDSTDADVGIVLFSVDCDRSEYDAAVGSEEKINGHFQISGFNAEGKKIHSYIIDAVYWNAIEVTT